MLLMAVTLNTAKVFSIFYSKKRDKISILAFHEQKQHFSTVFFLQAKTKMIMSFFSLQNGELISLHFAFQSRNFQ